MRRSLRADGHTWEAALARAEPHPGVRAIVFHCMTSSQEPYRVVEVPSDRVPDDAALGQLPDTELEELFRRAAIMDFVHDPAADPATLEEHPPRT
jgi:hypothetical protein